MGEYNPERAKEKLLNRIRHDKRNARKNWHRKILKHTAIGLIFLGLGYAYYLTIDPKDGFEIERKDNITLQLSDGTVKTISVAKNISVVNKNGYHMGLQKGNQLIYHRATTKNELAYNTLSVPYGKQFRLILADGTKVHLNSGTTLKYPVQFRKGRNREVFLQGEGYFEVAKDLAHPFIVSSAGLNIQVLGTKFNVSAYSDDENTSTVLVEGVVGFFEKDGQFDVANDQQLNPSHIANWQRRNRELEIEEVDTDLYTGWMDGKTIFNHMPFKDIRKKLERNYNVSISNGYQELDEVRFTASFDTETIGQVLQAFNKNYPIRYTINDRKIHIQKP